MREIVMLLSVFLVVETQADTRKAFNELKKSFPRDYRQKLKTVKREYKISLNKSERELDKAIKEAKAKLRKDKEKLVSNKEYKALHDASQINVQDIMLMGSKKGEKVSKTGIEKVMKIYSVEKTKYWYEKIYPKLKEIELSQAKEKAELALKKDMLEKTEIEKKNQGLLNFINSYDFSAFNSYKGKRVVSQKCGLYKTIKTSVVRLSQEHALSVARYKVRQMWRPNNQKIQVLRNLSTILKSTIQNRLQAPNLFLGAPAEKLTAEAYTYQQEMKKLLQNLKSTVSAEKQILDSNLKQLETENNDLFTTFRGVTTKQLKEYYKDLNRDIKQDCKDNEAQVDLNKFDFIKPEI
jgi:hypothetical protein